MSNRPSRLDEIPAAARPRVSGPRMSPLRLLPTVPHGPATDRDHERSLLAFDPADDLVQLIPMPLTIAPRVRAAITRVLGIRFEYGDELNDWLHAPNDALAGATPFESVVAGDGIAVLAVLLGPGDHSELRELGAESGPRTRSPVHLLR